MSCDDDDGDGAESWVGWGPPRETITHCHPSLPFVHITQERYEGERTAEDDRFEMWGFEIFGPKQPEGYPVAYDCTAYMRGDHSEDEMLAAMAYRAERHLLDDRGPFFVLRIYLETGEYRNELDAVMRKHGQSPLWRRTEAAIVRRIGFERSAIRMRYRLRGQRPNF
jgi:hypothetical protein